MAHHSFPKGHSLTVGNTFRKTHGFRPRLGGRTETTRIYDIWASAKQRCFNPKNKRFADYGGRGITMCDRWKNDVRAFIEDMGPRPPGTTLERKDNDGNYESSNCVWATRLEQAGNQRLRTSYPDRGSDGRFKK